MHNTKVYLENDSSALSKPKVKYKMSTAWQWSKVIKIINLEVVAQYPNIIDDGNKVYLSTTPNH